MTLIPAYGRDYKSKKELLADFNANKDFVICGIDDTGTFANDGKCVNKEQLKGKYIQLRYKKQTQVYGMKVS